MSDGVDASGEIAPVGRRPWQSSTWRELLGPYRGVGSSTVIRAVRDGRTGRNKGVSAPGGER